MRSRIHNILEITDPEDLVSRIFSISVVALILINIVCIVLESVASIEEQYRNIFLTIEMGSTLIFATEYALRLWSCVEKKDEEGIVRSNFSIRIRYASTPLAIVDLLAFLPSLLQLIFPGIDLRFLRVLRFLVFLVSYMLNLKYLSRVFNKLFYLFFWKPHFLTHFSDHLKFLSVDVPVLERVVNKYLERFSLTSHLLRKC